MQIPQPHARLVKPKSLKAEGTQKTESHRLTVTYFEQSWFRGIGDFEMECPRPLNNPEKLGQLGWGFLGIRHVTMFPCW